MGLEMPAASAIASTEAEWKPRSANARSATASISRSRTWRGTRRVPRVCEVTVRDGAIAVILLLVNLLAVTSGGIDVPRRLIYCSTALATALIAPASAMAQGGQKADPAGGAAIGEVILATAMATVVTVVALLVVIGHRSGRVKFVAR